jgi:hypothetical protein
MTDGYRTIHVLKKTGLQLAEMAQAQRVHKLDMADGAVRLLHNSHQYWVLTRNRLALLPPSRIADGRSSLKLSDGTYRLLKPMSHTLEQPLYRVIEAMVAVLLDTQPGYQCVIVTDIYAQKDKEKKMRAWLRRLPPAQWLKLQALPPGDLDRLLEDAPALAKQKRFGD